MSVNPVDKKFCYCGYCADCNALFPVDRHKTESTGTESRVIADIAQRQALGISKYGTTVEDNPLTLKQWLQHAYEECLDQAVYLKRAIEEIER